MDRPGGRVTVSGMRWRDRHGVRLVALENSGRSSLWYFIDVIVLKGGVVCVGVGKGFQKDAIFCLHACMLACSYECV